MTKPFQTDATLAREQNSHLFEDTLDPCADKPKEPRPADAAVLLDITVQQRQNNEKLMNDILHTVGKVQQNLDTCCARRFDTIVKKTAPGYRSGWLRANVESRYTHGQFGTVDYKTLALCQHGSFIKWPRTGPDGRTQYTSLQRCYFYPALITETMKMVFVRTTKKQITYLREEVAFGSAQRIGDTLFEVTVHFPKTDALHNNIIIYLKHTPGMKSADWLFCSTGNSST